MSQNEIEILKRALARERSARKQAEEILEKKSAELYESNLQKEKSKAKLQSLIKVKNSELKGFFENIIDPYIMMDLSGNVLKMNQSAEDLLVYKLSDGVLNLMNITHQEDLEYVAKSFQVLLEKGRIINFEIRLLTKNKENKLVSVNSSIIYDENNKAIAAHGILRDITNEKKYQKRIEAEKEKYSNIINNMNLGLLEVDKQDKMLFANYSFCEMSGYKLNELQGKIASDIFMQGAHKEKLNKENKERQKGVSNSYEVVVHTKYGEPRYWLISGAPNFNLEGEVVGSIGIYLDITKLKKLEIQKEELLKELEKSNESLQEYAHVVSHDLKSPLRSIDALVCWIKEDNASVLKTESLEHFDLIKKTLEKMENLISDVLEYSGVGSNIEMNKALDLNVMLKHLLDVMYIPENITVSMLDTLPVITGDRIKIEQLFQNLLGNAIKFNDKEKGEIKIGFLDMRDYYQFSVSDNGIGIEKKYHATVFKIFHSLQKRKDSSGIGLSMVKKNVELHKGTIWLNSEIGKGTTFYFTIKK